MFDRQTLANQLAQSFQTVENHIDKFSPENFNKKPTENSWSAAQILDHLLRVEMGINQIFAGRTGFRQKQDCPENINKIKDAFLDYTKKFKAYGPIVPSDSPGDQNVLITKFRFEREKLISSVNSLNLEDICLDFEHPVFGLLSRGEWLHFILYHTERHVCQISELSK